MSSRPTLLALTPSELQQHVTAAGGRPFHGRVILEQVLGRGVLEYDRMTALPETLRRELTEALPILASTELERSQSRDRTTKLLLAFPGKETTRRDTVETVHIPSCNTHENGVEVLESRNSG